MFDLGDRVCVRDRFTAPNVGGIVVVEGVVIEFRGEGEERESFVLVDNPQFPPRTGAWIRDSNLSGGVR